MLRNYLLTALRNIRRNASFSAINIAGLALGMTCSILILLWVQHEKSIDGFHENSDRLFQVYERQYHDGQIDAGYFTPGQLGEEMRKVLPAVEYGTNLAWEDKLTFQAGDKIIKQSGNHAGEDFFKMFSYPLIAGTPATALNSPVSIAISRKMANDFFGSPAKAMGQTLRFENRKDLKVTAVFENITDLSSIKFDYLINWQTFLENNQWAKDWGNNGPRTVIMLRKGTNPRTFEASIKKFLDGYNKEQSKKFYIEMGMQPYSETYLNSRFENGKMSGGRIEYARLFSLVAVFILVIACINFMNLTTARSVKRSREIGIRKVIGARRISLVGQFIGEAMVIATFAFILGFILVFLLLPAFNSITGKEIHIPVTDSAFWLCIVLLVVFTGFFSGSYPAFVLSAFQPVKVLKGTMKFSNKSILFRKGLVIFQFMLSVILIIGTIVVSKQVGYLQHRNLGYDRENVIYIPLEGVLPEKFPLFKEEILKQPGIAGVTRISGTITDISNGTGGVEWEGKDPNSMPMFTQAGVGYEFVKTMNLQLKAGRDFNKDFATDSSAYIINEAALKIMKLKNPVGSPITFWQNKGTIIGVLKDFHFQSLHEPIRPIIIRLMEKNGWGTALVRTKPGQTKQALAGIGEVCRTINPQFPFSYQFSDEEYQKLYKSEQVVDKLANCFAMLAIFISCLGLLGLAIFATLQRTKEIGIRKVLGASITSLFTMISKEFMLLVLIAFFVAAPLAWFALDNWLQQFAYRTEISAWIFLLAGFAAMFIALATVSYQAIKAALTNPVKSLKTE
ncbi:ABC transporter permease [Flavihumibacter solisilvae]|uniref:ABC transporter permease n=1 Tax=Flavihumibacter solisilvae TaxID=1349421 RepID=A0A0C1IT83_9BACT|nr:ABC transporter permease [Flavihumibacter solisilvae]KIC93639.1 hypothetical protein OI18_15855 [Flavihumibacter solisilvae]